MDTLVNLIVLLVGYFLGHYIGYNRCKTVMLALLERKK